MAQLVVVKFDTNGGTFIGEVDHTRAVKVGDVYAQTCNILRCKNYSYSEVDANLEYHAHFPPINEEHGFTFCGEADGTDGTLRISGSGSSLNLQHYMKGTGSLPRRSCLCDRYDQNFFVKDDNLVYVYDFEEVDGTISKLEVAFSGDHEYRVGLMTDVKSWLLKSSAGYAPDTTVTRINSAQRFFFNVKSDIIYASARFQWFDFLEVAPLESFTASYRRALFFGNEVNAQTYQKCGEYEGIPMKLPVPVRDGYRFNGWVDADGNKISDTTLVSKTARHTLTATWIKDAYTYDLRGMKRTNIADTCQILKRELSGSNFVRGSSSVHIGGYPLHSLPRYVNSQRQIATDSRWDESVGMHKPLGNTTYPLIQAYNVEAMPRVLKGFADYCVARNWRYRILIDGALSTLIEKFLITVPAETDTVINNGVAYLYEQTEDTYFQTGKTYYKRTSTGYYTASVVVGDPVRTQTGYVLTTDTKFVAGKKYYRRTRDTSVFEQYKYTLITGWTAGDTIPNPETVYNPEYLGFNDYYERTEMTYPNYVLRLTESDRTTPDVNRYYQAVASGATLSTTTQYYTYLSDSNDYVKCHLLQPLADGEHYYVQYYDTEARAYNYHTIEEEFPATSGKHTIGALDGKAIYRREYDEYTCVGIVKGNDTIIVGLTTTNNTYASVNDWRNSALYTQIVVGSSTRSRTIGSETKALYVDPDDEDIEAIKDATNVFLQRYRTILLVTGRSVPDYAYIKGDEQYTTDDIIGRINAIVTSMCEYSENPIETLDEEDYTVRDMKLKINEIVDYIVDESYYFKICDDETFQYNLRDIPTDVNTNFVSDMLYTMTNTSYIPDTTRSYNDRWYYYDPSIEYAHEVYQKLNYSELSDTSVVGNIQRQATTDPTYGGYTVCVDTSGTKVPLCHVANVYNMADTWSRCNYEGCMQILDLTLNLLNSQTPGGEGVSQSWKVAMTNPVKTTASAATKAALLSVLSNINTLQGKLETILAKAPAHADVMVDIAYHVNNLPKIVRDSFWPVRQEVTSYRSDTVFFRKDGDSFIVLPIHSAADFAAYKILYTTIYAWVFNHDRS